MKKIIDEKGVIEDYLNKMPWKDIRVKYKTSNGVIVKILKRNNLTHTHRPNRNNPQIQNIITDYLSGISPKEIKRKYNISSDAYLFRDILQKNNIPVKNPQTRITPEIEAKIINDYNNLFTIHKIEKIYKISDQTIRNILKKNNIPQRNHRISMIEKDVIKDYLFGMKWRDIYHKYAIQTSTVAHILNKNNISKFRSKSGKKFNKISKLQEQLVMESHNQGLSQRIIAKKYHIGKTTVYDIIKRNQLTNV